MNLILAPAKVVVLFYYIILILLKYQKDCPSKWTIPCSAASLFRASQYCVLFTNEHDDVINYIKV